jgi:RHS repeat-associated protein
VSTRKTVWSGEQRCEFRDATNSVTLRIYSQGQHDGTTAYFYTRDHLGSIREIIDSTGTLRGRYDYDPFGIATKVSGDINLDFGYSGHYHHAPSGLNLAHYRAYSPLFGRWINRDPSGEEGGLNLYGYTFNDPVNLVDPLGLDVRLESTDQVGGLHLRVSVDTPSGPYGQSYGIIDRNAPLQPSSAASGVQPGNGVAGSGIVYPDSDPTRSVILVLKTTRTEDSIALDILRRELNYTGPYNLFTRSCRDYSHERFLTIKNEILQRRRQQVWADLKSWLGF